MTSTKYIGMDVHTESISMAVRNSVGKVVMESVIETKASMILQFIEGLRGDLHVTFEEGTAAAWLYDLLKPHVARLVVCNPRRNALLKVGNKSDRIDARKLSELLRGNQLHPVYHGEHGLRGAKKFGRNCGQRATSTAPGTGCAEFPGSARSARRRRLAFCRHRTVFAPSGSCGVSVVLRARREAAPITAMSTANCKR